MFSVFTMRVDLRTQACEKNCKKLNINTNEYKSSWENLKKMGKLYQCQFPGCSLVLRFYKVLQNVIIKENWGNCTQDLLFYFLPRH